MYSKNCTKDTFCFNLKYNRINYLKHIESTIVRTINIKCENKMRTTKTKWKNNTRTTKIKRNINLKNNKRTTKIKRENNMREIKYLNKIFWEIMHLMIQLGKCLYQIFILMTFWKWGRKMKNLFQRISDWHFTW